MYKIIETAKEFRCFEDFDYRYSTEKIDFYRKWYHTRSKVGTMLSLEDIKEDDENGDYEPEDKSAAYEDKVISEDYYHRFKERLSEKDMKILELRFVEQGLSIKTVTGDAREVDKIVGGKFDHILLMGPMYHLLDEKDRIQAVESSLRLLKSDGVIFVSFINLFAGMIYYMKHLPNFASDDFSNAYLKSVKSGISYGGEAFTKAYFANQNEVLPFISQFPLEKLHLFGQEGVTSPCETNIMSQNQEVINQWLDFSESVWEREEFLSYSEHLMYVGRKI